MEDDQRSLLMMDGTILPSVNPGMVITLPSTNETNMEVEATEGGEVSEDILKQALAEAATQGFDGQQALTYTVAASSSDVASVQQQPTAISAVSEDGNEYAILSSNAGEQVTQLLVPSQTVKFDPPKSVMSSQTLGTLPTIRIQQSDLSTLGALKTIALPQQYTQTVVPQATTAPQILPKPASQSQPRIIIKGLPHQQKQLANTQQIVNVNTLPANPVTVNTSLPYQILSSQGRDIVTMAQQPSATNPVIIPVSQESAAPVGSSKNPIRIVQKGNKYFSYQDLTPEQMKQIEEVVQQRQLARLTLENKSRQASIYNAETNTNIICKIVEPNEMHTKHSESKPSINQNLRRPFKKRYRESADKGQSKTLTDEEKKGRKRKQPRTRSGRISRPPKHMIQDYKHIHLAEWHEDYDDSDGGYSDYDDSQDAGEVNSKRKDWSYIHPLIYSGKPRKYKCLKCDKAYIGKAGLYRHYKLVSEHCPPGLELEDPLTSGFTFEDGKEDGEPEASYSVELAKSPDGIKTEANNEQQETEQKHQQETHQPIANKGEDGSELLPSPGGLVNKQETDTSTDCITTPTSGDSNAHKNCDTGDNDNCSSGASIGTSTTDDNTSGAGDMCGNGIIGTGSSVEKQCQEGNGIEANSVETNESHKIITADDSGVCERLYGVDDAHGSTSDEQHTGTSAAEQDGAADQSIENQAVESGSLDKGTNTDSNYTGCPANTGLPTNIHSKKKSTLKLLLQSCTAAEYVEVVMPRLSRIMSTWEYLLQKCAHINRGPKTVRHRMFDVIREFERLHRSIKKMCGDIMRPTMESDDAKDTLQITGEQLAQILDLTVGSYTVESKKDHLEATGCATEGSSRSDGDKIPDSNTKTTSGTVQSDANTAAAAVANTAVISAINTVQDGSSIAQQNTTTMQSDDMSLSETVEPSPGEPVNKKPRLISNDLLSGSRSEDALGASLLNSTGTVAVSANGINVNGTGAMDVNTVMPTAAATAVPLAMLPTASNMMLLTPDGQLQLLSESQLNNIVGFASNRELISAAQQSIETISTCVSQQTTNSDELVTSIKLDESIPIQHVADADETLCTPGEESDGVSDNIKSEALTSDVAVKPDADGTLFMTADGQLISPMDVDPQTLQDIQQGRAILQTVQIDNVQEPTDSIVQQNDDIHTNDTPLNSDIVQCGVDNMQQPSEFDSEHHLQHQHADNVQKCDETKQNDGDEQQSTNCLQEHSNEHTSQNESHSLSNIGGDTHCASGNLQQDTSDGACIPAMFVSGTDVTLTVKQDLVQQSSPIQGEIIETANVGAITEQSTITLQTCHQTLDMQNKPSVEHR